MESDGQITSDLYASNPIPDLYASNPISVLCTDDPKMGNSFGVSDLRSD